jgi:nucleotide-binding universal stress UspA family protein
LKALIAIDLQESTALILAATRRFCGTQVELCLIHVAEPDPAFVGWDAGPQSVRESVAKHFHEEHVSIQNYAQTFRDEGYSCKALLIQGPSAESINGEAKKIGADLIVLGTHGKGITKQLLVGSVSESVLRNSQCPVLLIPTR